MIDIAIVGGGPAGLLSATLLAQAGFDVRIFEEHHAVGRPTHCTGIVSLETEEFAKVPDEVVLNRLARARMVGPGAERPSTSGAGATATRSVSLTGAPSTASLPMKRLARARRCGLGRGSKRSSPWGTASI